MRRFAIALLIGIILILIASCSTNPTIVKVHLPPKPVLPAVEADLSCLSDKAHRELRLREQIAIGHIDKVHRIVEAHND